jgi:hypothetical protein
MKTAPTGLSATPRGRKTMNVIDLATARPLVWKQETSGLMRASRTSNPKTFCWIFPVEARFSAFWDDGKAPHDLGLHETLDEAKQACERERRSMTLGD